ncbi:MAG: hypothetical protein ACJAS1_003876 [Oleiphilaceae bacterium]|jgi:hypothetical protein
MPSFKVSRKAEDDLMEIGIIQVYWQHGGVLEISPSLVHVNARHAQLRLDINGYPLMLFSIV